MKIKSSLLAGFLSGILCVTTHAQTMVRPNLPTGSLTEFSPAFHALLGERFKAELASQQQYMAIAQHPATYRLSLSGMPQAFKYSPSQLTLHGDIYAQSHGFQKNVHISYGLTATVDIHPRWTLLADLHYDFGYKYYRFSDVVTEHPDYENIPFNKYFHTPTISLGFVHYNFRYYYRLGFVANGSIETPTRFFSAGGTAFFEQAVNRSWQTGQITPYINYTYYSYDRIGHTATAGCNIKYRMLHGSAFYRTSSSVQAAGLGIGLELGKYCYLGYTFIAPFRFSGIMAGVAAHHFSFRASIQYKKLY